MPTNDYNSSALIYKALFDALNRTPTVALVPENEEYNRDELLHFIEEKFKTGIKGGITAENLRATLHTIVKSSINKQDDEREGVLAMISPYVNSGANNRWYFGNFTNGWNEGLWSQYVTTTTIDSSSQPTINGLFSHMGIKVPFTLYNFKVFGSVAKSAGTGIVDFALVYTDEDNNSNVNMQNVVHLLNFSVDCTVTSTSFAFSQTVSSSVIIPVSILPEDAKKVRPVIAEVVATFIPTFSVKSGC